LFADDTAIYIALTSTNQSVTLQNDLKKNWLEKWELEWDMKLTHPGPKHHFWGRGFSLFLGENMHDFGILWEKGS
jgi:hypothetical protein